jgi:MYXO-CTERM domain-containing protein
LGNIKVIILKGGKMMLKKILNSFVALSIAVVMLFGLNVNAQNNNNNNDNNGITRVATTGDVTDDDTDWGWIGLLGLAGLLGLRRRNDRKD